MKRNRPVLKRGSFRRGSLDDLLGDAGEDGWVVSGELGEDLPVEHKTVLLQLRDEHAVGTMPVVADGGIEPDYPELAEIGLLVASMGEGVAARAHERFVRITLLLGAHAAIALGSLQNILAALLRHDTSFDSCHTKMITRSD